MTVAFVVFMEGISLKRQTKSCTLHEKMIYLP